MLKKTLEGLPLFHSFSYVFVYPDFMYLLLTAFSTYARKLVWNLAAMMSISQIVWNVIGGSWLFAWLEYLIATNVG